MAIGGRAGGTAFIGVNPVSGLCDLTITQLLIRINSKIVDCSRELPGVQGPFHHRLHRLFMLTIRDLEVTLCNPVSSVVSLDTSPGARLPSLLYFLEDSFDPFHIQFGSTVVIVDTVLLLFHVGQLCIAESRHVR